ncbi:uncharacterized protein ACLA_037390 [Aspergillus clavatus NRRL 1]|uniref:Uncharacterized protein n=1 Tax=Aspergillus clavatus (strain ATCC 1007 / CBS 513.65 / DSM 816 / NCTC 3887 / NRRL 1 / QM 1276 / 107) TaxID=344612 RepID=A1CK58_ASPCL|nr:uncharacterized protein ACLA_037390 [Aspergillus clavatus NRRL 1]EAW09532.1 hypothetical protein ACLA_037390 [Aspergillus clavatus NRRL 1]
MYPYQLLINSFQVGSSLELSQRLDEPLDGFLDQQEHIQQPSTPPVPLHIFDIRRSNSVTELWKKYEHKSHFQDTEGTDKVGESPIIKPASPRDQTASFPTAPGNAGLPSEDESESLLAAFEAEMARMLSASESGNGGSARETTSDTEERAETASSDRRSHPSEALAQAVHILINGAGLIGSEMRSRLPELEHQLEHHLQNAQRALPEHVGSTVQAALTTLESQMRHLTTALNNASVARSQSTRNLFQGEIPTPAQTVDALYSMASEFGQMGHTLYSAFETEFGALHASRDSAQPAPEATSSHAVPEVQVQSSDSSHETEKDTKILLHISTLVCLMFVGIVPGVAFPINLNVTLVLVLILITIITITIPILHHHHIVNPIMSIHIQTHPHPRPHRHHHRIMGILLLLLAIPIQTLITTTTTNIIPSVPHILTHLTLIQPLYHRGGSLLPFLHHSLHTIFRVVMGSGIRTGLPLPCIVNAIQVHLQRPRGKPLASIKENLFQTILQMRCSLSVM